MKIGITERGDAALDTSWIPWVQEGNPAILITKDPFFLFIILGKHNLLDKTNYIVHCTITGMGNTIIEPFVTESQLELASYLDFINHIGPDRTVLRIDPIIPTEKGIETALNIAKKAKGRVRISFLDMYNHVKERFRQANIPLPYETFHAPLDWRQNAWNTINSEVHSVEVCGEPDFVCTGCVSEKDLKSMNIDYKPKKGGFQRQFCCCCLAEKFELLKNRSRCSHKCLYCYWKD